MIALGRSRGAAPPFPTPASDAYAVSRVLRGSGRTSGVPVSGSEMTWTARPKTSPVCRGSAGLFLGGLH